MCLHTIPRPAYIRGIRNKKRGAKSRRGDLPATSSHECRDPKTPFARVIGELRKATWCSAISSACLVTPVGHSVAMKIFCRSRVGGEALKLAGIHAVGSQHVHDGTPHPNRRSRALDELGIPHAGAGPPRRRRSPPVVLERGTFVRLPQRSSSYWPTNHEARKDAARNRRSFRPPRLSCAVVQDAGGWPPPATARASRPRSSPGPMRPIYGLQDYIAAPAPCASMWLVASCHWVLAGRPAIHYGHSPTRDRRRGRNRVLVRPHYFAAGPGLQGKPFSNGSATSRFTPPRRAQARDWVPACWSGRREPAGHHGVNLPIRAAQY